MDNNITKIQKTTDYNIFKGIIGNRALYEPHVKRLTRSVMQKNMLEQNPILVNERMEVVDGQHRLEVAKELQLPVFYVVLTGGNLNDVILNNANNRGWSLLDYLESYIAMGKKDYIKLKEFADEHKLSVAISRRILAGGSFVDNSLEVNAFKEGNFKIGDYDRADRIASLVSKVREYSPDMAWRHRTCVKALAVLQDKVDPKQLVDQLSRYGLVITRRNSVNDYLREFENIINANKAGNSIHLVK